MRGRRGYHDGRDARLARRDLLRGAAAVALVGCGPALRTRDLRRVTPSEPAWGVQSGDVTESSAVIWSRAEVPGRMRVEWSTSPRFDRVVEAVGPLARPDTDLVGKVRIDGLPAGRRIHYRASFDGSPWSVGSFSTPARDARDVVLAWSGDTNGQGWGIDPARGGMPAYAALLARAPDLFVHCGDSIYADDPIQATVALAEGGTWNNLLDPAKAHVAQTLDDFRGAQRYPRLSAEVRALSAAVPLFAIWDDHEVRNNWFPGQVIEDERYGERRIDELARRARRAFDEYTPTLAPMYRVVPWGPLLDLFLVDGRTFRTPNEPAPAEGSMLGAQQATWLVDALSRSRAVWKIVACNMPIGCVIAEYGKEVPLAYDGWANENGPPRVREVELARILATLRERRLKNVVWVTADVHYAAAHHLSPARAVFKDFDPFWELVAGPMHATAFPQKSLDDTFGAELEWATSHAETRGTPANGAQHFGLVRIDGRTHEARVTFVDARGRDLHTLVLAPR